MIDRYQTEEMKKIWSDHNKYATWMAVELAVCRAWSEDGLISEEALRVLEQKASFSEERILEIENTTHHDLIAFVSAMAESVGEYGRYIHIGLTSSDVVDTAGAILLCSSLDEIVTSLKQLLDALMKQAVNYKYTPCVGRTHGIHGEPITFGLKLLNFYAEFTRDLERLQFARQQMAVGKISGAVGTYAFCPPHIERRVCELLRLTPAPISNQIIQRDRHANVINAVALLGCSMERLATEIRHLQRTEVFEALEPFGKGQKGSSAMPHKRNPILCERICGMARLLRGYALSSMEDVALWHERDISHSSVERVAFPDAFGLAHYMLRKMKNIVSNLEVNEAGMEKNLNLTRGLIFSQRVLLELVEQAKLSREEAYAIVQENAMKCWKDESKTFLELLASDDRVSARLTRSELESLFNSSYHLRYVDEIFSRFDK